MTNDSTAPRDETGHLRALMDAVRTAITLPYDTANYDRRILDRTALARTVLDAALTSPSEIAWNSDYLRRKLALEEQTAAEHENNHCRRCRKQFDPADIRFDGRARYKETPWCRWCIDLCHDGGTEHVCIICDPQRYGGGQ